MARTSRPLRAMPVVPRASIAGREHLARERDLRRIVARRTERDRVVLRPVVAHLQLVDPPRADDRLMVEDHVQGILRRPHAPRRHRAVRRVDFAVAEQDARVEPLVVVEAVIDPGREAVFLLLRLRVERRQREQRIGGRDRAAREAGEQRRHRARACRAQAPEAGMNSPA